MTDAEDPSAALDSMLHEFWIARRDEIMAEVATLVTLVQDIVSCPNPSDVQLQAAAGAAHDLTGVFGALQQPEPMQVFRSACDDLRAADLREGEVDVRATLAAITEIRDGLMT